MKLPGLREVRELHGLSQSELASIANISRDSISNYETGQREAWPSTARKLADALGVEIADLVYPKALALSNPLVHSWLRGRDAKFALMNDAAFREYVWNTNLEVNSEGQPDGLERIIRDMEEERDRIRRLLRREFTHGGALFQKASLDTPEEERTAARGARVNWQLERELDTLYNRRIRGVMNWSQDLFYEGLTGDFLVDPRKHEQARKEAFERAFAEQGVA